MAVASRASPIKITSAARSVLAAAAKSEVGCPRKHWLVGPGVASVWQPVHRVSAFPFGVVARGSTQIMHHGRWGDMCTVMRIYGLIVFQTLAMSSRSESSEVG